jgi:hypothetical protein
MGSWRIVAFALLLVGCQSKPSVALKYPGPAILPNGWTDATDDATGVSVGLPSGWRTGLPRSTPPLGDNLGADGNNPTDPNNPDPNMAAIQNMAKEMQAQDEAAEKRQLAKMREKDGIILHAVDGSRPTIGEEPTRLYVIQEKHGFSLEDAVTDERSHMSGEDAGKAVEMPVGKAWRLFTQGQNRIGDVECHISYLFVDGDTSYVLRFASTNSPEAILNVEAQVAATFRVRKK